MASSYEKARAVKTSSRDSYGSDFEFSGKTKRRANRTIKKSPLLIIICVTLIIGAIGGFFLTKSLSKFEMNNFYVNEVASKEVDYVVVDVSLHKETELDKALKTGDENGITMEEVYSSLVLKDDGVTLKFMGIDISNTLSVKYLYREDISHNVTEVSKIDVSVPGVYYIQYTSSHFAYKNVTLIRTIIVTGVEVDG